MPGPDLTRKDFVRSMLLAAAGAAMPTSAMATRKKQQPTPPAGADITLDDLRSVEKIAGILFTDEEREALLREIRGKRAAYDVVRDQPIVYTTEPRTVFTPLGGGSVPNARAAARATRSRAKRQGLSDEDLAFSSLTDLAALVRSRQVSPVELTELYLDRLKRYGDPLLCVVTLTEEKARRQAKDAEAEIAAGRYRGPLHGIPYGIKDLFAAQGYPTTWGADPYKAQTFGYDAAVVERLNAAGAVMVAKLSMGALAMGDVWFRGTTKNPWNPKQGSSGSSAGSASATAAGLVGFSIGTETLGSIVSPSVRCRVTGLRPTYGRVSRYGGMALSYTMDKAGPICRAAEDCALVLAAIAGSDPRDPSAVDRPFAYPKRIDYKNLKVGWLTAPRGKPQGMEGDPVLKILRERGATIRPVSFAPVPDGILEILDVESSSAFDAFTRGEAIHELKDSSWPVTFRAARYVPAVEYLQAQRARTLLMERFEREFGDLDFFVCNGGGYTLGHTNLTGHPQIVIPLENGQARSLVGRLYREDVLVTVAKAIQDELGFTKLRPDLSKL